MPDSRSRHESLPQGIKVRSEHGGSTFAFRPWTEESCSQCYSLASPPRSSISIAPCYTVGTTWSCTTTAECAGLPCAQDQRIFAGSLEGGGGLSIIERRGGSVWQCLFQIDRENICHAPGSFTCRASQSCAYL